MDYEAGSESDRQEEMESRQQLTVQAGSLALAGIHKIAVCRLGSYWSTETLF